ncbi:MAG: hypothetical protein ACJ77K_06340 [Bacteroidia bacterium]
MRKRTKLKIRNLCKRSTSLLLAFSVLFEITFPTQMWALTGGPSQPEVQAFEPIGTSDMVDVFSGDFNYNIPLLDVEGYPINIAYHSGIGMDQEASWVGLGWNINPGVINRNMRGLPDDFSGDVVTKETNMKPNMTWGVGSDVNLELYGYDPGSSGSGSIGFSMGFSYNNYNGPSVSQGINIAFSASGSGGGTLNAGLGLNTSSDDGLSIQPSVGYSQKVGNEDKHATTGSLGATVGTSFNSRGGLKQLSINASASLTYHSAGSKVVNGKAVKEEGHNTTASMGNIGAGGTFDFGSPTWTPYITNSMKNYAFFGKFTLGGEIIGVHGKFGFDGSFSTQKLAHNSVSSPAFGYLYSENGQLNDNALMDFNREKDGPYNENMAGLPVTNYTFDTYAVSGQGIGGSYRPFRSEVGYVFDPAGYTTNDDGNVTVELGIGNLFHVGSNIAVTDISGSSGKWKSNNNALPKWRFSSKGKGNDYENVYFKEANEKTVDDDPDFYAAAGFDLPVAPSINFSDKYEPVLNGFGPVKRKKRAKRTQNFYYLTKGEYADYAVKPVTNSYSYATAPAHHIAEVTTLATDGSRYVYGLAAYNTTQKEVTFSIGSTDAITPSTAITSDAASEGLIAYIPGVDNSTSNSRGLDNYYCKTTTPGYAHSYLLTSVLSTDYIDADNVRGPSDGDYGSYTRFAYKKVSNYKWRVPFDSLKASYTEGLKSDRQDDKANYIYGEKELWYLDSVVTKNYVAVFHTSCRQDGAGVEGEDGGYDAGTSAKMLRLDSISLYSKADLRANPGAAQPIKRVHFEYTYDLCKGIPNATASLGTSGKLTLKKIYFTYQNSNKGRLSPYIFDYHESNSSENPDYNLKAYDRWGNYKPNNATTIGVGNATDIGNFISTSDLAPSDYPYVEQNQPTADVYSSAWSLKEIQLPSGGVIKPTYESDDYAYVQDRQAMQMFKVVNTGDNPASDSADVSNALVNFDALSGSNVSDKFYFKLQTDANGALITDINKYISGITNLYFRYLVQIRDIAGAYNHLEYVSGYGTIDAANCGASGTFGWIAFNDVKLEEKRSTPNYVNPIIRTAVQYARLYMPKKAYTADLSGTLAEAAGIESSGSLGASALDALVNSGFIKNIKNAIAGPNYSLYDTYDVGQEFVAGKSWVRLMNPNNKKLGGGMRVKKIEMIDEWAAMTGGGASVTSSYGQEYTYTNDDGTSSGVASYEPQLGGDENPFRQPLPYDTKKLMVPNDNFYQEEPFGESFFPTPSVGYSKVTVKNLHRSYVTRHATGKVVHEFYTAKDFPTITTRTDVNHVRAKDSPFSIRSLLKINVRDYLTAAQGFVVEVNDMHGKPKSQSVYQEGQLTAISSVQYNYKKTNYKGNFRLINDCTTVKKDGSVATNTIGEFFDMVTDIREDKTITNNISVGINVDEMMFGVYPLVVPSAWPTFAKQKTRFRSATSTKVIQRFGILEETVAQDLGSVVSTKNIAYDAETGDVLLTQTTTNFNDQVYSLKYPAWWYYESMGPAYQNIGFESNGISFSSGIAGIGSSTAYFREGDELALNHGGVKSVGWVTALSATTITVVDKAGSAIPNGSYTVKVIRSGKRNTMTADMATITTLTNPVSSVHTNIYENVLQAGAVEFSNVRKTHCDCIGNDTLPYTTNPYITGTKGNWRPLKSYTHLTGRSQSNYDNNTNIRKDGVFVSYTPYYKQAGSGWQMDPKDWTYVSEVTEFNQFGEELENKDALARYSSATFGYNQSMALSVAANSQYKEQGFDGFEDYSFNPCADDHFKFQSVTPSTTTSHTGKYSLKISHGSPKTLTKLINPDCTPETICNIVLTESTDGDVKTITISGATAPVSISWDIISGAPTIANGTGTLLITGSNYIVEITVTDANGCTTTNTITQAGA